MKNGQDLIVSKQNELNNIFSIILSMESYKVYSIHI